ncbi:MAG: biopolymer transporter ExbD [Desulfamplus sp.]|nr:biopolymer transporter ExbD [Desulfamplus sp.]
MLVHRKTKPHYQIQMPLTSLIDIVFMLLIYFMLTANFIVDEGIDIKLPQANQSDVQEKNSAEAITVYIDKDGKAYIKEKLIPDDKLFITLKQLIGTQKASMDSQSKSKSQRLVIIKADKTVILNSAVKVMDIAKSAGAARLCIATEKEL